MNHRSRRFRTSSRSSPEPSVGGDFSGRSAPDQERRDFIHIQGQRYKILKQLSLPERGRWLVRDPQPRPRGTLRTAIVLEDSSAARQLERSLFELPKNADGIPQLIATGYHQAKKVWIVTWLEGMDLERYLQRVQEGQFRRMGIWEPVRRIKSLAHGLWMLDKFCGIVHGDIKPRNLILPFECGSIGLIDYGSSWQISRTAWRVSGDGAEAAYAAPEFWQEGAMVDSRADQFSTAVVLYEMLTTQLPYAGLGGKGGWPEYRRAVENELEPPSQLVCESKRLPKSVLAELDLVVCKALKLDANQRFATPGDFATALNRLWIKMQATRDVPTQPEPKLDAIDFGQSLLQFFSRWLPAK